MTYIGLLGITGYMTCIARVRSLRKLKHKMHRKELGSKWGCHFEHSLRRAARRQHLYFR